MIDLLNSDYFAGFADGEGCFIITKHDPANAFAIRFLLKLRADTKEILEQLQQVFGGGLSFWQGPHNLQCQWQVAGRCDILRLIEYFDRHELVIKRVQYRLWREAALHYYRHSTGRGPKPNPQWLIESMEIYAAEVSRLKLYDAGPSGLTYGDEDDVQQRLSV